MTTPGTTPAATASPLLAHRADKRTSFSAQGRCLTVPALRVYESDTDFERGALAPRPELKSLFGGSSAPTRS